ncbi:MULTISPECIES: MmgE/PrpD family protein [Rhodococcus]|uniref:MmgE/PrpD family protein n=1 Tax=Rhodococcus jostii TaxID=132919 RepID=A0ABU4CR59_RHOJO|nr:MULTISPECIES: MmgE/PrpD family protein [Rhodococcus]MDI9948906.1 MmgE/PrpD family protein [Rhodococcus sp. IEGM 1305]MDI9978186.1 MmgE/PrpD family protein [Rhodococcus sp. IEGM 1307]MDV6286056.1 MmgE/PrpD family protein [Rhodococcus jostii]
MTSDSPSLTERLATFWARTGYDDLPKDVVDGIKDHILDTLAVALVGTTTPEVSGVVDALSRFSAGDAGSLVWGTATRLTPAHAALVNGTSAHARDFDDGGGPGHAGSTVLPAALAVAEKAGSTGRQVIAATVAGYDIGYRTLQAVGGFAAHTDRGWHSSGTMGSFAAAAAAAKCLDADKNAFADALGIAGSFTGGVWAFIDDGALTKRLHPGKAGETGVDAAVLATGGITGPRRIFEAKWGGLYAVIAGGTGHTDRALTGLGTDFNVASSYLKPYACCRGCHSAVDVMKDLVTNRGLTPENVRSIVITAGTTAVNMLSVYPIDTVFDAQFSLPYAVSLALCASALGLDDYDPPRLNDPRIAATFAKVSMRVDDAIEIEDGPRLDIELTNGETLVVEAGNPTYARGSAQNPMTHDEVVAKATLLLEPLGGDIASRLVAAVEALDDAPNLSELLSVLAAERVPTP